MLKKKTLTFTVLVEKISWLLLSAACVVLFLRPVETGDIWWHLKAGEFIVQHGFVPVLDPFPFAGEKSVWILTQWLGSLIYYFVYHSTGLLGLKVFRLFVLGLVVFGFVRYSVKRIPGTVSAFLTLLLVLALHNRPHLRPFVFNYFFIQIFLAALFHFAASRKFSSLVPIMLSGPIWVNIHLGSFMYGVSLIGIFLFSSVVDFFKSPSERDTVRQRIIGYGGILVLFLGAFLFNPYGLNGALHPVRALFFPDYLNFGHLQATISELQPPHLLSMDYIWFWGLFCIGVYAVYVDRANRFRNLVLILCSFSMFLYGQRAGLFFVLVVLYTFIDSFKAMDTDQFTFLKKLRTFLLLLFWAGLLAFVQSEAQKRVFVDGRIYPVYKMTEDYTSPAPLIKELKFRNVQGAVFNDDSYGGYLLWHNYPELRPFSDTRQINLKNFKLYTLILSDPARYWPQVDLYYKFKAVMLDANKAVNRKAINFFLYSPEWNLVLVQGDKILFVRKNRQAEQPYVRSLLAYNESIHANVEILKQRLAKAPTHHIHYIYMEPAATAITLYELGFRGAALERLVYSFKISDSPYQHEMARLILDHLSTVKE